MRRIRQGCIAAGVLLLLAWFVLLGIACVQSGVIDPLLRHEPHGLKPRRLVPVFTRFSDCIQRSYRMRTRGTMTDALDMFIAALRSALSECR